MNPLEMNKSSMEELQTVATENSTATEASETTSDQNEVNPLSELNKLTKSELVDKLRETIERTDEENQKAEVDLIKQIFYKKLKQETAIQTEEDQTASETEDVYEVELKALLADFKDKRAKINAQLEAAKTKNLQLREAIIAKINTFLDSPETIHEHVAAFKQLQQEWREIGPVPTANASHLFKTYNLLVENFYDLLKMNNELRDYDFKKNLELKTAICETAEKLDLEKDIVSSFHTLQELHNEWAHIGPVAKDLREALWARFKEVSTQINKKHQTHFEAIKEQEEQNLLAKVAICEIIENIDFEALKTFKDWEDKTTEVIQSQQNWKNIGFATRKMNVKIYERYRQACDGFFSKKSNFYKEIKEELNVNLEKKKALIEKAESLKDNTDWKETTRKLVELQKEWKSTGAIPRKQSDLVWKQFIAACDYFFEQKEKAFSSQKTEEKDNLAKKLDIIKRIEGFTRTADVPESVEALKTIISEFNEIGHVPFKEKDKIYKQFRTACDVQFDALNVEAHNRHIDAFAVNLEHMAGKDKNRMFREREKLLKQFEQLKHEILTCENNFGFFSSSSKKPSPMIVEMQRNIERLKGDKELLLKKIQLIEAQLA